jgi:hypothetical protein
VKMATVYRSDPDDWRNTPWDFAAIPGNDVLALEVRHLHRLPAPWRIKVALPGAELEACSVASPGVWSGAEFVYLLAALLLRRVTETQVVTNANLRKRMVGMERWRWNNISGGLVGIDPQAVDGTVGDALALVRGRIVGAWSGIDARVEHGEEEQRTVPRVLPQKRKPRAKVPQVSRRVRS